MSGKRDKKGKKEGKRALARTKESDKARGTRKEVRGDKTDQGHVVGSRAGVGCCERREEDDLQTVDAVGACDGAKSARSGKGL